MPPRVIVRVAASGRTPCPRGEGSGILLCALAADLSQQKLVAGRVDHDELLIAFGRHRLGAHALAWLGHHRTGPIIHDDPARNRAQVLVHYLRQDDGVDPDPVRLADVLYPGTGLGHQRSGENFYDRYGQRQGRGECNQLTH